MKKIINVNPNFDFIKNGSNDILYFQKQKNINIIVNNFKIFIYNVEKNKNKMFLFYIKNK